MYTGVPTAAVPLPICAGFTTLVTLPTDSAARATEVAPRKTKERIARKRKRCGKNDMGLSVREDQGPAHRQSNRDLAAVGRGGRSARKTGARIVGQCRCARAKARAGGTIATYQSGTATPARAAQSTTPDKERPWHGRPGASRLGLGKLSTVDGEKPLGRRGEKKTAATGG